jgi:hypothetical protein
LAWSSWCTAAARADFLPLAFRLYAPDPDGLTKNELFQAMFAHVVAEDKLLARPVLFDSWYAASANLRQIHCVGWTFFTTLKSNRLVSLSQEAGYQALDTLPPPASGWSEGVEGRLQQVPFSVKCFKLVATDGSMGWGVTNHLAAHLSRELVIKTMQVRWQVEQFHRSFQQLTGSEKCQCRKANAQRNPLPCCYLAWVALRQYARAIGLSIYQAYQQPWSAFLRQQLQNSAFRLVLLRPA